MEKPIIEELKAAAYWVSVNYQQNFYEVSSDWNKYNLQEHLYLKNYIGYALYGPPEFEELCDNNEDGVYVYKDKGSMQLIEQIYNKIVEHGTQLTEEKEVLCSILYNCIYDESSLKKYNVDRLHELIYVRPIFKVQKHTKNKNKVEYKNYYIDTEARVYCDWNDYLKNNNLPTCIMIAPKDGIYQADLKELWSDKMSNVWVETHTNNISKEITKAVDLASTFVNFGCVGIGIASIFNPISAPIAIAGAVGCALSGAWGGGRAISELVDRGTHDQSISVINKEAIPAWLGVAGSTLGLAASSGSALLSRAIRTGTTIGKGAQIAHDAIMIGNLFVNGVGIGFNSVSMVQKFRETGEVSARDVFFLTAHVLFVCNFAVKMRLASDIIRSDQNQILKDYEDNLRSNRHRKEFRRLVRNTGSNIVDEVHRNEQIIRTLTKINNKDEFFTFMVRNRKIFATSGTQLSCADGKVQINGVALINPSTFATLSQESILSLVNQVSGVNSSPSIQASTSTCVRSFISANALKAGATAIQDFYVQKSVASSTPTEQPTSKYTNIISDLQNYTENSVILKLLLDTGLQIAKKVAELDYTIDHFLADATNFIWNIVKINLGTSIPGFNILSPQFHTIVKKTVQALHDYVKANSGEWTNVFRSYMNSRRNNTTFNVASESNSSENSSKDSEMCYNDMTLINPVEIMFLPKDISSAFIKEALLSTGSQINETVKLPKDIVKMCTDELNDFFSKHPTLLDFTLTNLSNEFKCILFDLKVFDKKNIIFYKLMVISVNIVKGVTENQALKKDVFVDVMKFLWIFVNLNFYQTLPKVNMLNGHYENFIIRIIIALYNYQITEPEKWLSAFYDYREKYGEK